MTHRSCNILRVALVVAGILIGLIFQSLIPPFQSPDEFAHIKRAYLLSKGKILLDQLPGENAGGDVDTGLLAYFEVYKTLPYTAANKISQEERREGAAIKWSHVRTFSQAGGTAYYFPISYLPQALGLSIGEHLDFTVQDSYRLARLFALAFCVAILALAFSIFPTNAAVLSLLILPMSLFQFASASLDGVTTALTVLCVSLFMRAVSKNHILPAENVHAMSACIFILATCRIHLLPLVCLPLVVYLVKKDKLALRYFFVLTIATLSWNLLSVSGNYLNRETSGLSTSGMVQFYVQHPLSLASVLAATLQNKEMLIRYMETFIGIVGWLDTRFTARFYVVVSIFLIGIAALSISTKGIKTDFSGRLTVIALSLVSSFFIFFALLITWNPLMPKVIEGVQGRYFIGPMILFAYALSGETELVEGRTKKVALCLLAVMAALIFVSTPNLLIERYFQAEGRNGANVLTIVVP